MPDPAPARRAAGAAAVLLHGRGQTPAYMLEIMARVGLDLVLRAPAAPGQSWYPESFMAPRQANASQLALALDTVEREVAGLEATGWPGERIALIGFSQGACLACEYTYRRAVRHGALIAFTGGLIGPAGSTWPAVPGLAQLTVFLGCGSADPWVPWQRVEETGKVFRACLARVETRCYPGREHIVCDDEIANCRSILQELVAPLMSAAGRTSIGGQPD